MTVWVVVVAAGGGTRFGRAKQLVEIGGRRAVDLAVAAAASAADAVVVVVPPGADWTVPDVTCVPGGATRAESVRAGLAAVPADVDVVVVHDAARPLAGRDLFRAVIAAVEAGADGAVPGLPVSDTIKRVDADGVVTATLVRSELVAVQTPQAFRAAALRAAHRDGPEGTDDAAVVEAAGGRVVVVPGDVRAMKITRPEDLAQLERWCDSEERS